MPGTVLLPDLKTRHRQPELMDQPLLDQAAHRQALRALVRVNRLCRSSQMFWPSIRQVALHVKRRPVRILDIGCGAGDIAITLWRKGILGGIDLGVTGCDVSEVAVDAARRNAQACRAPVTFDQLDVLESPLPPDQDVIISSLFLHHLEEEAAVTLLGKMACTAQHLVLIADLVRGRRGYLLAYVGSRLLSRSYVMHADGPLSVGGAFLPDEALALAIRAGMSGATVSRRWPQRFLLRWPRR